MSKVALRLYNREIETLIDQGHLEEAVAHCQHILKVFPKHIDTYRLLGKAYMEAHRYNDAVDIFQRVLMAVPDDFVSHLGMSLIRDEQKDLDGAIWHMERAFEINPSNVGVQNELRRLYGRRDGLEPPKIRLTRGALAQMYSKGGQYQQAIAEIKSVLAEDPTRTDLKLLLARTYFLAGQKVEATEACTDLLTQYPFTLDANRILVQILPGTSMAASVETYRKRAQGLDPYAALATQDIFDTASVQDNAISVDRLEYDPNSQPAWSTEPQSSSSGEGGETIPDWMKSSGWGPSTGEFQDGPMSLEDESSTSAAGGELAAAEIPDWLKGMAPPQPAAGTPSASGEDTPAGEEDMAWLSGLGAAAGGIVGGFDESPSAGEDAGGAPDWLSDMAASGSTFEMAPSDSPEPIASLGETFPVSEPEPAAPAAGGDFPDWLKGVGEQGESSDESSDLPDFSAAIVSDHQPMQEQTPPATAGTPQDWMADMENTPGNNTLPGQEPGEEGTGLPDWLGDLTGPGGETPAPQEDGSSELSGLVSGPGVSADDQDDAMKWLESLAANQGAKPEELLTKPEERTSEAPEWLGNLGETETPAASEVGGVDFAETTATTGEDELSPLASGPGVSEDDQDDAMKWLENLAANQGAKPEELLTNPGERTSEAPDWLGNLGETETPAASEVGGLDFAETPSTAGEEELSPLASGPGVSEDDQDDAMKWLESLAANQGAKPEELLTTPEERTSEAPDWLGSLVDDASPFPATDLPAEQPQAVMPAAEDEDDDAWLANLMPVGETLEGGDTPASEPDDEEFPVVGTPGDWATEPAPDAEPSAVADELPAWMRGETETTDEVVLPATETSEPGWVPDQPADPAPDTEGELPAWMRGEATDETAETPVTGAVGEIGDWLNQLDAPAGDAISDDDTPATFPPEMLASETADVPGWVEDLTPEPPGGPEGELPAWLKEESDEPVEAVEPEPIAAQPLEWVPAEQTDSVVAEEKSEPVAILPSERLDESQERMRQASILNDKDGPMLQQARDLLASGDLANSMAEYGRLIKKGRLLEETVYDLQEATYNHPVDVVVWQTLGDAYMRMNRLQEALDAYTKAEELLR